jgi:starch phosphorylase
MEYDQIPFDRARRRISLHSVFTTHTPVAAGHDRFPPDLVEEHLGVFRDKLGLSPKDFLALGRVRPDDDGEPFCMTVLALKNSRRCNAVSAIHGDISRRMWQCLWPDRREVEIPIGHITNGVHVLSWLAPPMEQFYQTHLGSNWASRMGHPDIWATMEAIKPAELWETHQSLKMRVIRFVRRRLAVQAKRHGASEEQIKGFDAVLDPTALTIGFARRFALYKRPDLIFRDVDRLKRLVLDDKRPIQIVFAGKAHPRDEGSKKTLQRVAEFCSNPDWKMRIVFVEDYDYNVTRHLVQGVDVWLNNPQRPLEACGTSGQKAVLNGVLNLSILDGWWNEAYDGFNGFAIGDGGMHSDTGKQYERDAESLIDVLENQIIPLYYDQDEAGIPIEWVRRMKWAVQSLGWRYNADRMIKDYARNLYLPAADANSSEILG